MENRLLYFMNRKTERCRFNSLQQQQKNRMERSVHSIKFSFFRPMVGELHTVLHFTWNHNKMNFSKSYTFSTQKFVEQEIFFWINPLLNGIFFCFLSKAQLRENDKLIHNFSISCFLQIFVLRVLCWLLNRVNRTFCMLLSTESYSNLRQTFGKDGKMVFLCFTAVCYLITY